MELKEKIPHKAALLELIAEHIASITIAVQGEVGHLEGEYTKFRRYHRVSVLLISLAFLLPNLVVFMLGIYFTHLPLIWGYVIGILTGLVSLGFCGYYGGSLLLSGYDVIQQFHKGVDKIIFNKIFDLFEVRGTLISHSIVIDDKPLDTKVSKWRQLYEIIRGHIHTLKHSPESDRVLALLATSELITEPFNYTRIDNVFEIIVGDSPLFVSELDVKNVIGSGKDRSEKNIFKGYFISFKLKQTYKGKTFISTEGDLHGFAHRTYWTGLTVGDVREVVFNWSEFENLLHVATSNEPEAREIITAIFMHDLYNWWTAQGTNIRISFVGDQLFMLFPDEQIRFEETITEIDETKLQEYLLTVAEPLLNVLYLIEDVRV
jgi:Protein of unknown function (DUF3137)